MRRIFVFILLLAAALGVVPARSGTSSAPELRDAQGDSLLGQTDLTGQWFSSMRDESGALTGIAVSFETVADPDSGSSLNLKFEADWNAGPDCYGRLVVTRDPSAATPWTGDLAHVCSDVREWFLGVEAPNNDIAFRRHAQVTVLRDGRVTTIVIPLSTFDGWAHPEVYSEGAALSDSKAFTAVLDGGGWLPLDRAPDMCLTFEERAGSTRTCGMAVVVGFSESQSRGTPFVIGS